MDTKTTPRSAPVRNGPTTSSLKLRRRREGSNEGNSGQKKSQHRHSGDFMHWTKNVTNQTPIQLAPQQVFIPVDRMGLRQFPVEPSRRHPRQQQLQQQQQNHYQPSDQNHRRFAKSFQELLAGCDIDDVNCMETLDRKISATDEELEEQDNISDWSRCNPRPDLGGPVVIRRRKPPGRSGKRFSGIETDEKPAVDKTDMRNFRKSCDLSSYQMAPPQNLSVFGLRHDLYNHVRFELSQKATGRPRETSSDFFVQPTKDRDRSTSRKGSRYPETETVHSSHDPSERLELATTVSCVTTTGGDTSLLPESGSETTAIRKGVLWQQRDKVFSRWKERFFLLTPDYLQGFKKSTNQMTEMGRFIFKLKLSEIVTIELVDKRGYLIISLSLAKEGKILLRKPEGIKEWFQCLKECITRCKERKGMMKTTKEFWARKQFTDSASMEQWISAKQQKQSNNHRDDVESASVGDGKVSGVRKGVRLRPGNRTTDYGFIDAPPQPQSLILPTTQHHQEKRTQRDYNNHYGKHDLDSDNRAKTPSPYSSKDTHSHDSGIGSIEKHGRSTSPCNLDSSETISNSKWRMRKQEEKTKEISVDDLINNLPSIWQIHDRNTGNQIVEKTSRTMNRKSPRTKSCHLESFLVHQPSQRPQITKL